MQNRSMFRRLKEISKMGMCFTLLCFLVFLTGCNTLPFGNKDSEDGTKPRVRAQEEETTGERPVKNKEVSGGRGEKPSAPEEQSEKPDVSLPKDVESNGGHFVKVGDDVYFKAYDENTIGSEALWGGFIAQNAWDASDLMRYTKAGKVEKLMVEPGFGEIFFGNGRFYSVTLGEDSNEGEPVIFSIDRDGKGKKEIGEGIVAVSDEEGNYLLLTDSYKTGSLRLYDTKTEKFHPLETDGDMMFPIGIFGEYYFYSEFEYDLLTFEYEERVFAGSLKEPERIVFLGSVPKTENMEIYSTEFGDVAIKGSDVYIVMGQFAGTGYFLDSYTLLKASLQNEGSLTIMDEYTSFSDEDGSGILPKIAFEGNRPKLVLQGKFGDLGLQEESIYLFDENGEKKVVPDIVNPYEEWSPVQEFIEAAEYIDGKIYIIRHRGLYDLDASIGWREGFKRLYTEYLVYDPAKKNSDVLHSVGSGTHSIDALVWMGEGDYLYFQPFSYEGDEFYGDYRIYRADIGPEADYVPVVSITDPASPWDFPDEEAEAVVLTFDEEGMLINIQNP